MSVRYGAPPDTFGGSGDPPKVILAFRCSLRQIKKVLKFYKKMSFFHVLPPKYGLMGVMGQCHLTDTPKFDIFQVLNGCLWWYSLGGTQCLHATRGPWGSHELTYLDDPISVTFVTNGHQSCPNVKIS